MHGGTAVYGVCNSHKQRIVPYFGSGVYVSYGDSCIYSEMKVSQCTKMACQSVGIARGDPLTSHKTGILGWFGQTVRLKAHEDG